MKIGYARVSSTGQNLDSQIEALEKAGCEKIFTEKKSGKETVNRTELNNALEFARSGDIFIVTRLDRCSRSVKDLHIILEQLAKKDVAFQATEQELNTTTASGRLMIGLLSIVSAFETDLRAERQADGIASAKKRGVSFGRVSKMTQEDVMSAIKMQESGMIGREIAEKFDVSRNTLLRKIREFKE
jgi:DNA invertase Pin-like site-specific DNA recombinase